MQDYISRYGMDFNPFIKNAHDIIMETVDYKELKLRLDYLMNNKGFGVITGGPGRGKTTAIRNYVKQINNAVLNDLKMLFNFEMDSRDRAIVLLVGLPQLNNTLRLSANEPLRQRITMNFNIDSLTKEETVSYVKSKLSGAKCTLEIFNPNALEAIANASNGIPRIINKICNTCLMIIANKQVDFVDSEIVMAAVNDIELA